MRDTLVDFVADSADSNYAITSRRFVVHLKRHRLLWIVVGVALIIVIGFASLIFRSRTTVAPLSMASVHKISQSTGESNADSYVSLAQRRQLASRLATAGLSNSLEASDAVAKSVATTARASQAPLIARTVAFTVVVKDLANARKNLDALLSKTQGYAATISVATPENESPILQASLRIPVDNLPAAINQLRQFGRIVNESETGEDVTQQHADLDQRLKTARDTEARFRSILANRTGTVSDVLEVEEESARVRGEIESMEAEQTNLQHRVDFATIELTLSVTPIAGLGNSGSLTDPLQEAMVAGWRHAAASVIAVALFLVEYGPAILFWLALTVTPLLLARRFYRKRRARRQQSVEAAPTSKARS